jgi:hypothetical protein
MAILGFRRLASKGRVSTLDVSTLGVTVGVTSTARPGSAGAARRSADISFNAFSIIRQ